MKETQSSFLRLLGRNSEEDEEKEQEKEETEKKEEEESYKGWNLSLL